MLRGLKQTLGTPGPRDPTETETELCLSMSCGGMGQQWTTTEAGALGAQTWAWHKPYLGGLGGGHHSSHHRAARTYTGQGNRLLEGTNRTLYTRTQENGAEILQETDPDLPESV